MEYKNVSMETSNPGCIVILVDQSWSMNEVWGSGTKAEMAAVAVNRVLDELVTRCRSGNRGIKDRCRVSVIGYGERVESVVDGMISEVASSLVEVKKVKTSVRNRTGELVQREIEIPIWVQPKANNGTPMHEAFERAAEIVQRWCDDRPKSFPPITINITDGEANYPDLTVDAAKRIMNLRTVHGDVLVFNVHIANNKRQVIFPHSTTQLVGDNFAQFLFDVSSVLPEPLREEAKKHGLPTEPDTRGFAYNADPSTMLKILQFGTRGTLDLINELSPPLN